MAKSYAQTVTYEQKCKIIGDDDIVQMSLIQDGQTLIHRVTAYEEENCQKQYLIFDRVYLLEKTNDSALFLIHQKALYTPLTQEVAKALNLINYCGYRSWLNGQSKDVTGQKCDDFQQLANQQKVVIPGQMTAESIYFDLPADPVPYQLKRL